MTSPHLWFPDSVAESPVDSRRMASTIHSTRRSLQVSGCQTLGHQRASWGWALLRAPAANSYSSVCHGIANSSKSSLAQKDSSSQFPPWIPNQNPFWTPSQTYSEVCFYDYSKFSQEENCDSFSIVSQGLPFRGDIFNFELFHCAFLKCLKIS